MLTESVLISGLKTVYDPEIPVNIYDLGLIYGVQVIGSEAYIVMTLTTATCPAAAFLPEEVKGALLQVEGVRDVHVDVVFEPAWTPDRMSPDAKKLLGFGKV
jgi:metal-sulfur cluster biosynthetic enzyme